MMTATQGSRRSGVVLTIATSCVAVVFGTASVVGAVYYLTALY
jgi:hypothetical protein